ncbi:PhzF family phenazine biosynthesis protein [soil metagenome]
MKLSVYQIDAFADKLFGGNPAAVIPLQAWINHDLMQQIALENNLSETVFFVPSKSAVYDFEIRWFTPESEINLCGHATLATAYTLFNILNYKKAEINFSCKSGLLKVVKKAELIVMDFPSWKPERIDDYPQELQAILGNIEIVGVYKHRDLLVELMDENAVRNCKPDFSLMKKHIDKMIITAPGKRRSDASSGQISNRVDFVSRFFAPGDGINEDPVTGSAHSQLIPFWSEKLGKKKLHAIQLSKRMGELWCEQLNADRVTISGNAVFYMRGEIVLSDT